MKRSLILIALLIAGCATPKPPPAQVLRREPYVVAQYGHVSRVNSAEGYVILECTFLPTAGEEITLYRYRNKEISSRVRVNDLSSGRWVAADILEGNPMAGDWFIGKPADSQNQQRL